MERKTRRKVSHYTSEQLELIKVDYFNLKQGAFEKLHWSSFIFRQAFWRKLWETNWKANKKAIAIDINLQAIMDCKYIAPKIDKWDAYYSKEYEDSIINKLSKFSAIKYIRNENYRK